MERKGSMGNDTFAEVQMLLSIGFRGRDQGIVATGERWTRQEATVSRADLVLM